jgi:hypothetical protein
LSDAQKNDPGVSRDLMPLALLLLLKLRLKYDFTFDDPKADVWLAIALRTADACINEPARERMFWSDRARLSDQDLIEPERSFFSILEWKVWVREQELKDFITRMAYAWSAVTES